MAERGNVHEVARVSEHGLVRELFHAIVLGAIVVVATIVIGRDRVHIVIVQCGHLAVEHGAIHVAGTIVLAVRHDAEYAAIVATPILAVIPVACHVDLVA